MSSESGLILGELDAAKSRSKLSRCERWVVKIGSALLTADGEGLDRESLAGWVSELARLKKDGVELVLVSSGAIAEGMSRLGWRKRPDSVHQLQAAAALGQMGLVQAWESGLKAHGFLSAQILLTHDDLSDRRRYLNARATIRTLVDLGVVPIVNENDTVVTEEIRFGDNDTLAALVANLVEADVLVILTDQKGLLEADPRSNPQARRIAVARASAPELDQMAGESAGALGRGGMFTKLRAARLAARSGTTTLIASGREEAVLTRLRSGEDLGSLLLADQERWLARKQWIAGHLQTRGTLYLDSGAVTVLRERGKSLLPVGVVRVEGRFRRGEMVSCRGPSGEEVAKGLVNYDSVDAARLCGQPSDNIKQILGYVNEPELILRDNLVVF